MNNITAQKIINEMKEVKHRCEVIGEAAAMNFATNEDDKGAHDIYVMSMGAIGVLSQMILCYEKGVLMGDVPMPAEIEEDVSPSDTEKLYRMLRRETDNFGFDNRN